MALLKDKDRKAVQQRLARLETGVTLVCFTQEMECLFCEQTRELVEEVASLSEKINVEVNDFVQDKKRADELGIDKIPAVAVLQPDGTDFGLRFFGIPSGYEFMSLLESLEMVSRGTSGLSAENAERIKAVREPMELQVFVTPTCPYCPRAVILAFKMAMENPLIRASMVEATEFPHLSNRYGVGGVPHTVIGDSGQPMVGAYPEGAAVEMILAASDTGRLRNR